MTKNSNNIIYLWIWIIIFIILFIIWGIYFSISWKISQILTQENISFESCQNYIFSTEHSLEIELSIKNNQNDYKILEIKCFDLFPNKREVVTEFQEFHNTFILPEYKTENKNIDIPENTIFEKSTFQLKLFVPKPDNTLDVTFFGFSLWKVQNRENTMRIWATTENEIIFNYTLDELVYDNELDLIITNLLSNTMEISYDIKYHIEHL